MPARWMKVWKLAAERKVRSSGINKISLRSLYFRFFLCHENFQNCYQEHLKMSDSTIFQVIAAVFTVIQFIREVLVLFIDWRRAKRARESEERRVTREGRKEDNKGKAEKNRRNAEAAKEAAREAKKVVREVEIRDIELRRDAREERPMEIKIKWMEMQIKWMEMKMGESEAKKDKNKPVDQP